MFYLIQRLIVFGRLQQNSRFTLCGSLHVESRSVTRIFGSTAVMHSAPFKIIRGTLLKLLKKHLNVCFMGN